MQMCQRALRMNGVAQAAHTFNLTLLNSWFEQNVEFDIDLPSDTNRWTQASMTGNHFGFRCAALGGPATLPALIQLGGKSQLKLEGHTFGGVQLQVTGSDIAGLTMINCLNVLPVGVFSVNEITVSGIKAGAFISARGKLVAAPNNIATTFYTVPGFNFHGTWIVTANVETGPPDDYSSVALLNSSFGTLKLTVFQTSISLFITVAGADLQVRQNSGGPNDVAWTLTRLA